MYGTVSADGSEVTAAGRIRSCMRCHEKAPHGRLFGLGPRELRVTATGKPIPRSENR